MTQKPKVLQDIDTLIDDVNEINLSLNNNIKQTYNFAAEFSNKRNNLSLDMQPSADGLDTDYFADYRTYKANNYINLFRNLASTNSDYITETLLGKDQSNAFDIYKYEYTPTSYTKTMILVGGIHGDEYMSILGLYRFLYNLVNDNEKYYELDYIRNNIRLIVIPVANPWGVENNKRYNSNQVDLNRNFDYKWSSYPDQPGTETWKGSAAASEAETQYLQNVVQEYKDITNVCLSFHHLIYDTQNYYMFYYSKDEGCDIEPIINYAKDLDKVVKFDKNDWPNLYNYCGQKGNMHCMDVEFGVTAFTALHKVYGDNMVTLATNWYSNAIYVYSKVNYKTVKKLKEVEEYMLYFDHKIASYTPITFNNTAYAEITPLRFSFDVQDECIVEINGIITCASTTASAKTQFVPKLTQNGSFWGSFGSSFVQENSLEVTEEGNGQKTIPFTVIGKLRPNSFTQKNAVSITDFGQCQVGLFGKVATGSSCSIYSYKVTIKLTPLNNKDAFKLYKNTGSGFERVYF